jgi:hypothetical protein
MSSKFKILITQLFLIFIPLSQSFAFVDSTAVSKKSTEKKPMFRDSTGGAIDISNFLNTATGFMPVPIIVTQPAIGYGGGLAMVFIHRSKKHFNTKVPPSISGAMGLGTQNKTWATGLFHFHVWGADRLRYLGGAGLANVNIKYYGNNNAFLDENPVQMNLDAWGIVQRLQVRLGKTRLFAGLSYIYVNMDASVDTLPGKPIINEILNRINVQSTISMIQPMFNLDSRNNIFTPTKGMNTGLIFTYNATWLGGSSNFYQPNPYFLGYFPISKKVYSSWRFDGQFMLGDAPIYALPYVNLRGVPAMRYQSDNTMLVEMQWRYNFYRRWSIDAFTGTGKAFSSFDQFDSATWVYNYGAGFRYEIASEYGLLTGIDFASSNEGNFAFYIVVGSAWNK